VQGHDEVISQLGTAYAAFNRGDSDAAVALLDPKIEWTEPLEFPVEGMYHGREAVKHSLTESPTLICRPSLRLRLVARPLCDASTKSESASRRTWQM
jgi:ketosteroid isomerase-like protein